MSQVSISSTSDQQMIDQFQQGDKKAFDHLYERYAPTLFGIISRLIHDKKQAEQLLRQSFINIWQQRSLYDASGGPFLGWLINTVKKSILPVAESGENNTHSENQSTENFVYHSAEHVSDVSGVPTEQNYLLQDKALQLTFLCGKSQQEVAKYLNITPEQVAREVRSAINRISKQNL